MVFPVRQFPESLSGDLEDGVANCRLDRRRCSWSIEQHYRELKDELGLDHFEGLSYRGWNHHAVIRALAFTFLQVERRRRTKPLPTFPEVRNWIRDIVSALFLLERPEWLKLLMSFLSKPPLRI